MELAEGERGILAEIESNLSRSDPALRRRLAAPSATMPGLGRSYAALADGAALLGATIAGFALAVRADQQVLLLPMAALCLLVMYRITWARDSDRGANRSPRIAPRTRLGRRSSDRSSEQLDAGAPDHTDGALGDPEHAVIVGYGDDAASDEAVRFGIREAGLRRAPLVVLATYHRPVDPDIDSFDTPEAALRARARTAAEQALHRALERGELTPAPVAHIVTKRGTPGQVLLRDYRAAALIVIAAHPRRDIHHLLRGRSTSYKLIRHSTVPVVVVPSDHTHDGSERI